MKINIKQSFFVILKATLISLLLFTFQNCSTEQDVIEGESSEDILEEEAIEETSEESRPIINASRAFVTIQNPGFESGKDNWGDESKFSISGNEHSGSNAAKVTSSSGRIEQVVAVTPNTNYILSAWVDGDGAISVGGSTNNFDTDSYTQISITFNSGNSSLVTILGTRDSGDVRFDDFTLESDSTEPVTYTPERHQELVGQTFRLENVGSQLWARITATGDFKDLEMTPQTSTGDWPRWVVEEVNDGGEYFYRFNNVATNRRFRPRSATDNRVYTGRTGWTGNWTQWMVISQGNDQYILVNKTTGTLLSAGDNSDGALLAHTDGADGNKTLWEFKTLDDSGQDDGGNDDDDDQTPPPTGDFPFDVLGLDDWKITLPRSTDGDDRADEVYINANNNDDSSDPSFTVYEDEFFFVSDNGVTFSSPVEDGTPTTGNSSNTRSELREMPDDDNEDGWGASGSTVREMEFSARVLQTSSTKKLAFAQIHDYQEANWDDLIRIQIESEDANATVGDFGRIYILGDMAEGLSSEGVPSQPSLSLIHI